MAVLWQGHYKSRPVTSSNLNGATKAVRPAIRSLIRLIKAPIFVYVSKTDQAAAGSNWVKLYHDGYDGQWAVERLRANGGRHGITIPDIAPGKYLLRAEILALHQGYFSGGAQFCMECVQIEITSQGTTTLPVGVSIPGAYRADDPGVLFNLYNGFTSYVIPGPAVWGGASGPPVSPPGGASSVSSITTSRAPATTVSSPPSSINQPPITLQTRTTIDTRPSPPADSSSSARTVVAISLTSFSRGAYIYQQCGGINWAGAQGCCEGLVCTEQNLYYSQCLSGPGPRPASIWEQCGGEGWKGATTCHPGLMCKGDRWYGQCVPE